MEQLAEIEQAVTGVVRHFVAMRCPGDPDDLRAEAWRVALEVVQQGRYNPKMGSLGRYLRQAIRWGLGREVERHYTAEIGGDLRTRQDLPGDDHQEHGSRIPMAMRNDQTPELAVLARERVARHGLWRRRARQAIRRALGALGPQDLQIVERLWGLDGRAPEQDCRAVAREFRVPVERVYRLRPSRLRRRLGALGALRDLHRQSFEIRETFPHDKE